MKYLIIGNGVAGTSAAEQIRKVDASGEISIFSEEETPFYSRIRLINYLAGEAAADEIILHKKEWYEKNNVTLYLNTRITDIDSEQHTIRTERGESFAYDRLLIAAGGISFIPPISGSDKKGVFALRTIADADAIIDYAEGRKKIVLIGGGVLGLEAGNSLRKRGYEVAVVEFFPRLLPRQMDPEGAEVLKAQMEGMGFTFYLGAKTKEISGTDSADGVLLEDGTQLECDMIIVSAGVRPRAELATHLGLSVDKGVVVNDRMETEKKDIYAAGDLIEHQGKFYGLWAAAQKQGEVAGINMGGGDATYEGTTLSNVLKVVGVDLAAAGDIDAEGNYEFIVSKDVDSHSYKKLVIADNAIIGCIFYGDTRGYRQVLKAIQDKRDITGVREKLLQWDFSTL